MWKSYKPNVNHLRIFGCSAYAHIPKDERSKMDPKAKKSIFLVYGIGVKGYRLFDTDTSKVFHSRDVIFNETASINEQGTKGVENQPLVEVECENISSDKNSREATEPRRSPRIRKAPYQYGEWVYIAHRLDDPLTVKEALSSPENRKWMKAMESEINSLNTNKVWDLAELLCGRKAIGCKRVFKRKYDSSGNMKQHKARLVAQKHGVDYDEIFCPVVKFESVWTVIALAAKHDLKLHQLDITTAFLNGELNEDMYMKQLEGFEVKGKEHLDCKQNRSLYGLKQSPRCWNEALNSQLKKMHFKQLENDPCIYTLTSGGEIFIVAVYVDIILASTSSTRIQEFIKSISESFDIKDMGKLHYFLGVKIAYPESGKIWIGQPAYTAEVLKRFQMENSKPTPTPIDTGAKWTKATEDRKLFNQELYQSAISLLYLSTRTKPDIACAVSNVGIFCSKPTMEHWKSIKHIMRYLNGTRN